MKAVLIIADGMADVPSDFPGIASGVCASGGSPDVCFVGVVAGEAVARSGSGSAVCFGGTV